jgi:hypothetical protein
MDKKFCQQIDHESLVEQYVAGKLKGKLLEKFEKHLKECRDHAQAVLLEKAIKRGISDFARGEIKSNLKNRLKKKEDTRFLILRYAAILLVAVITPLLLYYQMNVAPDPMSVSEREESLSIGKSAEKSEGSVSEAEEPAETELRTRSSVNGTERENRIVPASPAESAENIPQGTAKAPEKVGRLEDAQKKKAESEKNQNMLKAAKTSPPPKLEATRPLEEEIRTLQDEIPAMAARGYSGEKESVFLNQEIEKKMKEDSLAIKTCIEKFISSSDRQTFLLSVTIQVLNGGKIGHVKIIKSSVKSSGLEACLFDIIKTWKLPDDIGAGFVEQEITY